MLALSDARLPEFYEELMVSVLAAFRNVIMVCEGRNSLESVKVTWKLKKNIK